jgi:hypothetical protein
MVTVSVAWMAPVAQLAALAERPETVVVSRAAWWRGELVTELQNEVVAWTPARGQACRHRWPLVLAGRAAEVLVQERVEESTVRQTRHGAT